MYTLYKFGSITLPIYNTTYTASPVPAQLAFVATTTGVFDNNGSSRRKQAYPFNVTYKALINADTAIENRTTLDALRAAVGTRATLYRKADDDNAIHQCTAVLVNMPFERPYENRNTIFEFSLEFQQLSPWVGTLQGTGWTFDSGILFDNGRNFDETGLVTLSLAINQFTVTNNGNLSVTDAVIDVTAGSEALTSLTVWNMTTNCRFYWGGILNPGDLLRVDAGSWAVQNAGADDFNSFKLDDPFHRNEYWMEIAQGTNNMVVVRYGGGSDAKIAFVFKDRWA